MDERGFYRFGAGALLVGTALALVFNLLHPRSDAAADDVAAELRLVAGSGSWELIHVALAIAVLLSGIGLFAVARSLLAHGDSSWTLLFVFSLAISTAVLFATVALDTYAMRESAQDWVRSGGDAGSVAFATGEAVVNITFALLIAAIGSYFGVTPVLLGVALLTTRLYPRPIAYLALAAGALGFVTAVAMAVGGPSNLTLNVLFPISSVALTIAAFWTGLTLWRAPALTAEPARSVAM